MGRKDAKLSERERRFVEAFMGPAKGNATKAARLAGCPAKGASTQGWRMLRNVEVGKAIAARRTKETEQAIMAADARDRMASAIAAANHGIDPFVALKALDMLNKVEGRYSSELRLKGKLGLEASIDATVSRK